MQPLTRRLTRTGTVVLATLAVGLAATGCGSSDPEAAPSAPVTSSAPTTTPTPTTAPSTGSSPSAGAAVPAILEFTGTTAAGADFAGSTLAGKPVVLWFWAPWCAVCRSQGPDVTALAAKYGDDLSVIGIGSLDSADAIAGFADDVRGPTHLSDPKGELWKRFRISEQSSFVVLDASGKEVLRSGYNDDGDLNGAVERLVG